MGQNLTPLNKKAYLSFIANVVLLATGVDSAVIGKMFFGIWSFSQALLLLTVTYNSLGFS